MKKSLIFLVLSLWVCLLAVAWRAEGGGDVCVKVRGNGSHLIEVRVGPNKTSGACCSGVSKDATVTLCGKSGYQVFDEKTKRLLFVLSPELNGSTIDLRSYY